MLPIKTPATVITTVSDDLKLLSNGQGEIVGEAVPSSSPELIFIPFFHFLRPASARFFPYRFLPSTAQSVNHGPEEIQAHETSTRQT